MPSLGSTQHTPSDAAMLDPYISTMLDHIEYLKYRHPVTYNLLDQSLVTDAEQLTARVHRLMNIRGHSDFNDVERGLAYRARQSAVPRSREYGDRKILEALEQELGGFTFKQIGLDVIGGNGTTARNTSTLLKASESPYVIAGDPCLDMVNDALTQSLPAVWQCAQETLFADCCLDFVIGSRGFHHIPVQSRADAFAEAFRILKPGGVAVILDFEEASPTARWYSEGLDMYTNTGHRYSHFRRSDFMRLLSEADFNSPSVFKIYDPFRFWSDSAESARNNLLEHLVTMFGMVKLQRAAAELEGDYWTRIARIVAPWGTFSSEEIAFDPEALPRLSVFQEGDGRWRAEFPRVALCAIGVKRKR